MSSFILQSFLLVAVLIDSQHCMSLANVLTPSLAGAAAGPGLMQKPRILGGTEAGSGQFPWIISLHAKRKLPKTNSTVMVHDCGGAIAKEDVVLTAAHCVWNKTPKDLLVVAGAHNIKVEEESQQRVKVAQIILHPKYTAQDAAGPYDIAVLKLKQALIFNQRVGKAERAKRKEPAKETCYNAGWGNQFPISSMHYKGSDTLTTGKTTMISAEECKTAYPVYKQQLATAICARAGMFHGTCQGDSGGPLTCFRENGGPYLAGLVSFGFKVCNNGFHPDVYTDMGHPAIFNFAEAFTSDGVMDPSMFEEEMEGEPIGTKAKATRSRSAPKSKGLLS